MIVRPVVERRAIQGADEQDVHSSWRRMYKYTQRAGVCANVKRMTRRRERRQAKVILRREL